MTETEEGIALIGAGRLGTALGRRLVERGLPVSRVTSRTQDSAVRLAARLQARAVATPAEAARGCRLTLITVPDNAVGPVATELAVGGAVSLAGQVVAHCAGMLGLGPLSACAAVGAEVAALHPLAPVPDGDPSSLDGCWASVEASPGALGPIQDLCRRLDIRSFMWSGGDRDLYHAAAVLAGVVPVLMEGHAEMVAAAAGLSSEMPAGLRQLLALAAANTSRLGWAAGLSGPSTRQDPETGLRHVRALARVDRRLAEVYRLIFELAGELPVSEAASRRMPG